MILQSTHKLTTNPPDATVSNDVVDNRISFKSLLVTFIWKLTTTGDLHTLRNVKQMNTAKLSGPL